MAGDQGPRPDSHASERRATRPDRPGAVTDDAAVGGAAVADEIPLPAWAPTDGVIGPCPERQVLVVGATPTGLVLARLLHAAGYDPVLLPGGGSPPRSRVTYLSPASVEVLGALGLGGRLLECGCRVARATVRRTDGDGGRRERAAARDDDRRAPPVVVPTAALCRVLREGIGDEVATDDREIGAVSPDEDGVEVVFGDGVREWFDLVVDAGGGPAELRCGDRGTERHALVQHEAPDPGAAPGDRIEEVWEPTAVVQWLPRTAGSSGLLRVTTPEAGASVEAIRRRVAAGRDGRTDTHGLPDPGAFTRTRVRQVRVPDATPPVRWWGGGRVARCGPAACPAAPAAGMGTTLGVTDALGVVWAVANGGDSVPDAVDAYATNRARRLGDLRRAAACADRSAATPSAEPLASVVALRAVALDPFFGTAPAALRGPGGV